MQLLNSIFAVAASLAVAIEAHSTFYPHRANLKIANANATATADPPSIISWHVHICYMLSADGIKEAMALRDRATERFRKFLGRECTGRFDLGRLCMIRDHDFKTVLGEGPFPAGEWSIFVPNAFYGLVVPWMLQNRGNFSLLVHPNTGYEYEDHSIWASWAGQPWPLNLAPDVIGMPGERSNEHGHFPGDSKNPICVPEGGVCGEKGGKNEGPIAVCCSDLACDPSRGYGVMRCSAKSSGPSRFAIQG